jgi:hypothetical protein
VVRGRSFEREEVGKDERGRGPRDRALLRGWLRAAHGSYLRLLRFVLFFAFRFAVVFRFVLFFAVRFAFAMTISFGGNQCP